MNRRFHDAPLRDLSGTFGALLLLTPDAIGATKAAELDGQLLAAFLGWLSYERERQALIAADDSKPEWDVRFEAMNGPWHDGMNAIMALSAHARRYSRKGDRDARSATEPSRAGRGSPRLRDTVKGIRMVVGDGHAGEGCSMSDTRKGFFALIGSAAVSGSVLIRKAVAAPTLLLPSPIETISKVTPIGPSLLDAQPSQMHAFLEVKRQVPADVFDDWLEHGLRLARRHNGRNDAEMNRLLSATIAKHGSIIAAIEAGAV